MTNHRSRLTAYGLRFAAYCLLLTFLTGCIALDASQPTPTPWPTPVNLEQPVYTVERVTLVDSYEMEGEVAPVTWEALSFPIGGQLAAIRVEEGELVDEGQLLAELDLGTLPEQLEQAELELAAAQDRLAQAESQRNYDLEQARLMLERAELLLEQARAGGDETAIALQEIEVELAQLAVERLEEAIDPTLTRAVTRAQATVDELQAQIEAHRLYAPLAGQVVAVELDADLAPGASDPPEIGAEIGPDVPLIILAEPEPKQIIVRSDQFRVSELSVGQVVTVTHPWAENEQYQAVVAEILPPPPGSSANRAAPPAAILAFPPEHPEVNLGNELDLQVVASVREGALVLPLNAIREFSGRTFVVVQEEERQRRVDVTLGLRNQENVEIVEGLREGEEVVAP